MKDRAARRLWALAMVLALMLSVAPAAHATASDDQPPAQAGAQRDDDDCGSSDDDDAPAEQPAPAPAAAPAPVTVPSTAPVQLTTAPLVRVLAVRPTARRALRLRLRLARDAVVSVGLRRLPTGTLVTRRFRARAGLVTLRVGRRLRAGRYGVRVIANDYAGGRAAVRATPVRFRR